MKQYRDDDVAGDSWVQMDPVIHLSEGHRSDMLLDLSGFKREERVMVQASISDARDFDRVAETLIIQHPRTHLREKPKTSEGQRRRRIQTCWQFKHSLVPRKKAKANTLAAENLERVPITRTSLPLKIMIDEDTDESANAFQAHNDPVDP